MWMLIDFVEVPSIDPHEDHNHHMLQSITGSTINHIVNGSKPPSDIKDQECKKLMRSLRNVFLFRLNQSLFKSRTVTGFSNTDHHTGGSSVFSICPWVVLPLSWEVSLILLLWRLIFFGYYGFCLSVGLKPGCTFGACRSVNGLHMRCVLVLEYHTSLYQESWSQQTTEDASHVLLISDPQVSVPSSKLFSLLHAFSTDKFLKKSGYVTRHLDPQAVFFLGDMLSDGKSVKNEAQWVSWLSRNSHSLWTPPPDTVDLFRNSNPYFRLMPLLRYITCPGTMM